MYSIRVGFEQQNNEAMTNHELKTAHQSYKNSGVRLKL